MKYTMDRNLMSILNVYLMLFFIFMIMVDLDTAGPEAVGPVEKKSNRTRENKINLTREERLENPRVENLRKTELKNININTLPNVLLLQIYINIIKNE